MNRPRLSSFVLALALAVGGTLGASTALGQVGTSVTYQGQLKNNGVAVNSPADVRFSIWDSATAGTQIGTTDTKTGVAVSQGLFSTTFDCGVNPYAADAARWLQIEVRNPSNVGGFVLLGSRQRLTAAPFSAATRGIEVDSFDNVAITKNKVLKTTGPTGGRLHIQSGNDGTFDGLYLNPFPNGGNVYLGNGAGAANLICYDRVGVGVNPPVFPLEVSGRVKVRAGASGSGGIWYTDDDAPATERSFFGRGSPTDRWTGVFSVETNSWPMIVKDSGNVGIGTNAPSHKLTVQGDTNTMRLIGPTGSFQWNSRLNLGDSDYVRISENDDDFLDLHGANGIRCADTLSAPAKNFRIDHPSDPQNKILNHGCIESDQYVNLYRGNAVIGNDGGVWIQLPSWMNDLNTDFSYQLTSVGAAQPNLFVAVEVNEQNQFRVAGGQPGAKVSWQITGVRHDAYVQAYPLVVEEVKTGSAAGTYLSPNSFGIYTAEELAKIGNRK